MTCAEINEVLAAYALDALTAAERTLLEEHFAGCREHDAELAGMSDVAAGLPLAASDAEPPPSLRARLLDSFDQELATKPRSAQAPPPRPISSARSRRAYALLAAAAVLVALAGVVVWIVALQTGGGNDDGAVRSAFVGAAGGGELVYDTDDQTAHISLELPAPAAGRVYQAWGIEGDSATSLGLVPADGAATFDVDLSGMDAVAISEEPSGGSEQPTTQPLLVAELP